MRAVVTGGCGFVGSHLCEALIARGDDVTAIDNLATGELANIAGLVENRRFSYVAQDICESLPRLGSVDAIFHFASPASPIDYANAPHETLRVNSVGTQHCCELAIECGARLIFASTSEVYGDPLEHPQRETYFGNVNPNGPRSCYDEAKRFGEATIAAYERTHGLDARIVRIFNTYGPRMRRNDGRVVPAFIAAALDGTPFPIFGDGSQTRSLCYVDDLVDGVLRFAAEERPLYRVINIGNDREVTVMELAQIVADLCGVELQTQRFPLPQNDPLQRRPDLTRAREALHWSPQTSLETGLRSAVQWFKSTVLTKIQ